jgi:hypothetical protein
MNRLHTRLLAVLTAGLVAFLMGGSWSWATPSGEHKVHKSYVCKYVGTPGENERLQTGRNPIWVDNHALLGEHGETYVGQEFSDKHGRSIVIVANTPKLDPEPSVDQCPAPDNPKPDPEVAVDYEKRFTCEVGVESRSITTTTDWVFVDDEWVLDPDTAVVETGDWTFVRDLTPEERAEYQCDDNPKPDPEVITDFEQRASCESGVEERTSTTTTDWVLIEGDWVLDPDSAVTEVSDWTFVRDLTKAEQEEYGCEGTPPPDKPEDPKDPPKADKPDDPAKTPPMLPHTGGEAWLALVAMAAIGGGIGLLKVAHR